MFRRYADEGASIADLARWLTGQGVSTRTGKHRWDRSVIWGMLRNPAYAGTAVFGKTMVAHEPAGLNRVARLQGRSVPRAVKTVDRPGEEWTKIPVPAIVSTDTFERVGQRLADNKRFAARNTKIPSLLQGLAACSACGYGYYRTSTRTTNKKIYYYRCLGSDDYRYEGGRVCGNKPVRADYLDTVVWDHITSLLADPALIRAEISKRLETARTCDPVTRQRNRLELEAARAATSITAMIEAFSEQLLTIDELRARMPHLRARQANLRTQIDALDAQAADRDAYLKLADDLQGFLTQLRGKAATADVEERQRVLRLLVKDVLIGPEKITIRHRIPARAGSASASRHDTEPDTEGDHAPGYPLRWGRDHPALGGSLPGRGEPAVLDHARLEPPADQSPGGEGTQRGQDVIMAEPVECRLQVRVQRPQPFGVLAGCRGVDGHDRVMAAAAGPESVGPRLEPGLPLRFQRGRRQGLKRPVGDHGNPEPAAAPVALRHIHPLDRQGPPRGRAVLQPGRHVGFLPASEHDTSVDPGRLAASVDLRHPPHAHQSAAAGTEHQLLQVTDPGKVPGLRCREDPPSQPPYVFLGLAPVRSVPVQAIVLRSVHQIGVQLVPRFGRPDDLVPAGSPDPRQRSFEPGNSPIRPVMREPLAEEPAPGSRFPAAFRPPAFASRVFLRPLGDSASLTVGLPAALPPDPIGIVTFRMR